MSGHTEFESPVDLPPDMPGSGGLRWVTVSIAVASLFLLATNAFSLREWVEEQPAGPLQAQVASIAAQWEAGTGLLKLTVPRAKMHEAWKEAQAARFKDEERPPLP